MKNYNYTYVKEKRKKNFEEKAAFKGYIKKEKN